MRFAIINRNTAIGIAHFPDDAMDCARRMSGNQFAVFTPAGEMLELDGTQTGYRIMALGTATE
jgi:hypothetical protein